MKPIKVVLIIIAVMFLLAGFYFMIHGSLEQFPTDEQMGKAKIAGVVMMLVGFVIGVIGLRMKKRS